MNCTWLYAGLAGGSALVAGSIFTAVLGLGLLATPSVAQAEARRRQGRGSRP